MTDLPLPASTSKADWFSRAKLGIFIHWGIYAVNPTGESWPFFRGEISYEDYMAQRHGFTAARYDPQQWAELFKQAGANYAVLTTKHHDGFALWDTSVSDLSAVCASPAGRDLVAPFCQAMRENGLRVGLYFSHLDWSHPDYATLPKSDPVSSHDDAVMVNRFNFRERDPEAWERFLAFHRAQIRELCERFAPDLLWFDGDWERTAEQWRMKELREQILTWNPRVLMNSRMSGYGDYETPEQGLPVTPPAGPWEFCMTMNDHWGYFKDDANYKSVPQLVWYFVECVSKGGNLLLDIGPMADGTLPPEQEERLCGLGAWNRKHAEALYPVTAGLPDGHYAGQSTLSDDRQTLYLFAFGQPSLLALKGVSNRLIRASVVGHPGESLAAQVLGGASWTEIPGVLFVDVPPELCDPICTVVRLDFDSPIRLYRGQSGAIAFNAP